ncbi:MAG TPA: ATP-binding protein [Aquabacterium sp.]|nr:ATP-binding protein [Aquabacterium sp.]
MTIRRTLLTAFLAVALASTTLMAGLAFVKARQAVGAEIERNLALQAQVTSAELDKMMFERLQNAVTWSRLDVMQDLQVRDVDKRLSHFLADLQRGYHDIYLNLAAVDDSARVISSSEPDLTYRLAQDGAPWRLSHLDGKDIALSQPGVSRAGLPSLVMRTPIESSFTDHRLGVLRLELDWRSILDVLDRAAQGQQRGLVVLGSDGRVVAASKGLRERGVKVGLDMSGWRAWAGAVGRHAGSPLMGASVLVAGAASPGYGNFAGLGWTTLVLQPEDQAFAPVHRMAWIFAGLLGLILVVTVGMAYGVSKAIARPITELTAFTRAYPVRRDLPVPNRSAQGEVGELTQAFVNMVRDIDRSQENLVRASKLAVVGEMSSVIAHEVRTPLGILRSSAQMLQRESGISEEGQELLGFIASETERLNSLVSAMLDTARPRTMLIKQTDLHELLHKCIAMLGGQASRKSIQITDHLEAADPHLEVDEEQMTQVILNLLMNGLQILDHGGRVDVSTRIEGDRFCIDIADDGPGIDPAERTRVFEAFFFKREGGVGLGLAIVQQIVQAHGGSILAQQSPLGGALFHIELPRAERSDRS